MNSIIEQILPETRGLDTPFLLLNEPTLRQNYQRIKTSINAKPLDIFYSVKANNHPRVLKILAEEGSGFDVASLGEIEQLKTLGVEPAKITFSAPTKIPREIKAAYDYGIRLFAFDSETELDKIAKLAPKSKVLMRVIVPNIGSEWPLVKKFGASADKAPKLFQHAKSLGLNPYGITFHVGSQCHDKNTWNKSIKKCARLWEQARKHAIDLKVLNIGGGFPVRYTKDVPSVEEISQVINQSLKRYFGDQKIRVMVEPGRFVVGDAAILVASVINLVKRGHENWLYLDTGVYNGLQETLEGWKYEILVEKNTPRKKYILAGPTCDSTDIIGKGILLPTLKVGDKLYFLSAGAYTNSYERYNGFAYPNLIFQKQPLTNL